MCSTKKFGMRITNIMTGEFSSLVLSKNSVTFQKETDITSRVSFCKF